MATVTWTKIQGMSLARAVRQVGFDITVYEDYNGEIQLEVQKKAIKRVLQELNEYYYYETNRTLKDIKMGVYVICLSSPFAINYPGGLSEIIYIGRGNVLGRLRSHFAHSLFPFMQSLSGTDFDFFISEPKMPGPGVAGEYFKTRGILATRSFQEEVWRCGARGVVPSIKQQCRIEEEPRQWGWLGQAAIPSRENPTLGTGAH